LRVADEALNAARTAWQKAQTVYDGTVIIWHLAREFEQTTGQQVAIDVTRVKAAGWTFEGIVVGAGVLAELCLTSAWTALGGTVASGSGDVGGYYNLKAAVDTWCKDYPIWQKAVKAERIAYGAMWDAMMAVADAQHGYEDARQVALDATTAYIRCLAKHINE
jgi:hypothetical protein